MSPRTLRAILAILATAAPVMACSSSERMEGETFSSASGLTAQDSGIGTRLDSGPACGNGICEATENHTTCAADCPACTGNAVVCSDNTIVLGGPCPVVTNAAQCGWDNLASTLGCAGLKPYPGGCSASCTGCNCAISCIGTTDSAGDAVLGLNSSPFLTPVPVGFGVGDTGKIAELLKKYSTVQYNKDTYNCSHYAADYKADAEAAGIPAWTVTMGWEFTAVQAMNPLSSWHLPDGHEAVIVQLRYPLGNNNLFKFAFIEPRSGILTTWIQGPGKIEIPASSWNQISGFYISRFPTWATAKSAGYVLTRRIRAR